VANLIANFAYLATQGKLLTNYLAITHPSQPNYVAAVGGSTHGITSDSFKRISSSSKTIVDLLEAKGVSWSLYQEDMPYSGFEGSYNNQKTGANVRVIGERKFPILDIFPSKDSKICMLPRH
jgi:hypothetical protein